MRKTSFEKFLKFCFVSAQILRSVFILRYAGGGRKQVNQFFRSIAIWLTSKERRLYLGCQKATLDRLVGVLQGRNGFETAPHDLR